MNYYVYINGKEHHLLQGFTISEEYNETLDSATIIISNSNQLDLNPYDDVFIYGEWCGYWNENEKIIKPVEGVKFKFVGYPVDETNYTTSQMPAFYKHFLIDQFTENILILDDNPDKIKYSYTIDLFSETKGLETIQAPNISITQPLKNKISTITHVNNFLNLYNKKIKKSYDSNPNYWYFHNKYSLFENPRIKYPSYKNKKYYVEKQFFSKGGTYIIKNFNGKLPYEARNINIDVPLKNNEKCIYFEYDYVNIDFNYEYFYEFNDFIYLDNDENDSFLLENIGKIFSNSYSPDFTLNNPSLRQILDKLLITKDKITVVKDDKIYAMDISKRRGKFDLNKGQINYIVGTKSSGNYCTNLKRTYTDGLSQDSTGRYVEYLGFRNSDDALLSLSNMRVETSFPIYKINKFYMCYFKKYKLIDSTNKKTYENIFLCKQDITKLIKLNSERNVLSENIKYFNENVPKNIDELAKYKLATLGYDIGSNYIEGWGTEYSYPESFLWQNELKTYLENIFHFINTINPTGIYDNDYIIKKTLNIEQDEIAINYNIEYYNSVNDIPIPNYDDYSENFIDTITNIFQNKGDQTNQALHMKHIFFEIDYTPFYSGTIIQSKGFGVKNNVTINDNQSSSLSLLEIDGLAQKEKINRYGNKGLQINVRYTSPEQIQNLGCVYEKNLDKDIVIFHKEYALNSNSINCTYFGSKDYVLKDYFTSVYAKHRTYNLMSYGESIIRSENEHYFIFLSKDKQYHDYSISKLFTNFNNSFEEQFLSFYNSGSNEIKYIGQVENHNKINYGYFEKNGKYYACDSNIFVSGTSFCLNICMKDNVTVGNYILDMHNEYINSKKNNYMLGATQDFAWLTDEADEKSGGTTGYLTKLGFYFGHIGTNDNFISENIIYPQNNFPADDLYKNKLFKLPIIEELPENITNIIGFEKNIYKDNKERIDMTIQFEPVNDNEIYFSQWLTKLSDLYGIYPKFNHDIDYEFNVKKTNKEYQAFSGYYEEKPNSGGLGIEPSTKRPMVSIIVDTSEENWEQYLQNSNNLINSKFIFIKDKDSNWKSKETITSMNVFLENLINFNSIKKELEVSAFISGEIGDGYKNFSLKDNLTLKDVNDIIFLYDPNNPDDTDNIEYNNTIKKLVRTTILNEVGLKDDSKYLVLTYVFPKIYKVGETLAKPFGVIPESGGTYRDVSHVLNPQTIIAKIYNKIQTINFSLYINEPIRKQYKQNLFWVYTSPNYDFKEYMVYDELDNLNDFNQYYFYDGSTTSNKVIRITWINNNKLQIYHSRLDYGSYVLCYYKDENSQKYNFVFGFKPDKSKGNPLYTNSSTNIYLSVLSFNDLTVYDYYKNIPIGNISNEAD